MNTTASPIASLATAYQVAYIIFAQGGDAVDFIAAMDALLVGDGQAPTNCEEVAFLIRSAWYPVYFNQQQAA